MENKEESFNVVNNNKLIASFMQIPKCDRCKDCGSYKFGVGIYYHPDKMKYNSSWDWIMSVVEKVEKIENEIGIASSFVVIRHSNCYLNSWRGMDYVEELSQQGMTKMEAVYLFVVEYIKKYNLEQLRLSSSVSYTKGFRLGAIKI